MALARALQACTKESGSPIGVLCDAAQELQWYMAPLLILNGDKIVDASLSRPIKGECRTSPTPEEEATLLGNIKPEIKHKTELPQVPEQLEICEQVQLHRELPLLQLLSHPLLLNQGTSPKKASEPQEKAIGADAISATQWVQAYHEEN